MKRKLLYLLVVSGSILLFCRSTHAQIKTKIYYEGIPIEKLVNALNNKVEVTITPPQNFKKLLEGESVEDDNSEYKNRFAIPTEVISPHDNEIQVREKRDTTQLSKRTSLIEITPYFRWDKYPEFTYSISSVNPNKLKLRGMSWGLALFYKYPIRQNTYLVGGLGYFRYSITGMEVHNRFGTRYSGTRVIDYPSPLYIIFYTDEYWYHTISQSIGVEKSLSLKSNFFATGGIYLNNYFTFKQYYRITHDYPTGPPDHKYNRYKRRNIASTADLKGTFNKQIGKVAIGVTATLPVLSFWRGDEAFAKAEYQSEPTTYNSKWFKAIGGGISFQYFLNTKN